MLSHILDERKQATVGRRKAYKDQPHFYGDEYHGPCELPGGKEVSWTMTGKRKHPNKFPADDKIPKDAKDYLTRAYDNVELLNHLVNNILDVSRIETKRFELYRTATDTTQLINKTIKSLSFHAQKKQLSVNFISRLADPVILNIDDYNSLLESLGVEADQQLMKEIAESGKALKGKKGRLLEAIKKEL